MNSGGEELIRVRRVTHGGIWPLGPYRVYPKPHNPRVSIVRRTSKQLHLELQRNCLVLACWQIASSQIQFVGMLANCEQSDAVCWYVVVEEVEYLQGLNI